MKMCRNDWRAIKLCLTSLCWMILPTSICLSSLLQAADTTTDTQAPMEPLTAEQWGRIRTAVQKTQAEQTRLRAAMVEAQEKLAQCYAVFELDERQVNDLQQEIVKLQGLLLSSHHQLQKELRTLVGPDRFRTLSQRISNALRSPPTSADPSTSRDSKRSPAASVINPLPATDSDTRQHPKPGN